MGAEISKCGSSIGSHKLRKKEKGTKIERQGSIISLSKAQIYDDALDDPTVERKEGPQSNLPELSVQLAEEFDVHLKTIKNEAAPQNVHQPLTLMNSSNTVYYDFSEDNESFYDAQSANFEKEESDDESSKNEQLKATSSAQSLPASFNPQIVPVNTTEQQNLIPSSSTKEHKVEQQEERQAVTSVTSNTHFDQSSHHEQMQPTISEKKLTLSDEDHEKDQPKNLIVNVESTVHAVTGSDSEQSRHAETIDETFNNSTLEFDDLSSFENVDLPKVSSEDVVEKSTDWSLHGSVISEDNTNISEKDGLSLNFTEKDRSENNQIQYGKPNKTIPNLDDCNNNTTSHEISSTSFEKQLQSNQNISSKNSSTGELEQKLHLHPITSSANEEFQESEQISREKHDGTTVPAISDETKKKDTPSNDVSALDSIRRASTSSESELESDTREMTNQIFPDGSDATQTTVNELKLIIQSINSLKKGIICEADSQNTYQTLMKIMMQVNQIKNQDFDEEILNLQNKALSQINHCLKILKK